MLAVCVLPSGAWSLLLVLKNRDENSSGIDRVLWRLVGMVSRSPELCREMLTCVALARLSSGGIVVRPVVGPQFCALQLPAVTFRSGWALGLARLGTSAA